MSLMSQPECSQHFLLSWPTLQFSLIHLWLSQLNVFLSITTFICKNLQNIRSQRKLKTWTQRQERKLMLLCQKSICSFQKELTWICIPWEKLQHSDQVCTEISWFLHWWNSTKLTMWSTQLQHFCSRAYESVGIIIKIPSLQMLSVFATEKLFPWNPSLKLGWALNMKE